MAVRCLYNVLINNNINTTVIEKNLKDRRDNVLYELYDNHADFYGFSVYIWNIKEMLSYAADLKSLLPECKILFGGPEVSFESAEFFDLYPYVDNIICGEGENVIADLCVNYFKYPKLIYSDHYKNFTSQSILYDIAPIIQGDTLYYESSRGCPYHCSYCLSSGDKNLRIKSADKTLNDLLKFELLENNIKVIKFIDRTFNYDTERANVIWNALIDNKYNKKYHFEIRADLLNDESFYILAKTPYNKIQFEIGVQSLNEATLKAVDRSNNIEHNLRNILKLKELNNINIHLDLIIGLPFETYNIFKNSFNVLYGNCDTLQIGFLKLLKGTKIRNESDKYHYKYMSEPPYAILSNDFLSYDEINKLHNIESIFSRYSNSYKFHNSIKYLMDFYNEPFDLFEDLSSYIKNIDSIPQTKAYELLYSYAATHINEIDFNVDYLKSWLCFDFLLNENGSCPVTIYYNLLNRSETSEIKNNFIKKHKNDPAIFFPAVEAYRFAFSNEIYLFDRKNRRYYAESFV